MNQLLDHKEKTKTTKSSKFEKYIIWLVGILFLLDGFVGFAAFFYKMNTPWINFGFSLVQIYIGLKFILSSSSIGDLILSFFVLVLLTFSIFSSTFTWVLRNGIYMEMGAGSDPFQSGIEYTYFYDLSHLSRPFDLTVDLNYLALMILLTFVMVGRLIKQTRKEETPPEINLT